MVFIVGDTLRHQPMVVSHMSVLQFRGPITYCVLQWCHPMLTGTQRRTSCSTRMITLYGDHVIKLDSGPRIKILIALYNQYPESIILLTTYTVFGFQNPQQSLLKPLIMLEPTSLILQQ